MKMRTTIFAFAVCLLLARCGGSDTAANTSVAGKTTMIQWIDSAKMLGKINEGQKLAVSFRFKNAGSNPLVIESVTPSCGCTVANFPKEPIAPGAENEITAEFNSQGRQGLQHKVITVKANTAGKTDQLSFDVDVVKNPGASNDKN